MARKADAAPRKSRESRAASANLQKVQIAYDVVHKPIASLKPNKRNARTHSDKQIALIAESMRRYGVNWPILVRGETIFAGEGRWRAATLLGLETIPTRDISHLSLAKAREFMFADNKIADPVGMRLLVDDREPQPEWVTR